MGRFSLAELPPVLAAHVGVNAHLEFPRQGATSDVAFAWAADRVVVVKRCAHAIYLDWLRREHVVLRALAGSGLPVPTCIGYAENEADGLAVGWLVETRLPCRPLLGALIDAAEPQRVSLCRSLGVLVRQLHAAPVPTALLSATDWTSQQLLQARANLSWCDGTAAGLAELERSRPSPVPERLIHGDLALDNVLVDARGALSLIDWAGGGSGDPRHDVALVLENEPEVKLTAAALDAFFTSYGSASLDKGTRDWFVRLYDYF